MKLRTTASIVFTLFFITGMIHASSASIPVFAQTEPVVQELQGSLVPGEVDVYRLEGLKAGQTLYVTMETTSGNLDSVLALVPGDADLNQLFDSYQEGVQALIASSAQPLLDLPALRDRTFLAWDDDGGPGYSAALTFVIPMDGDYYLGGAASLSAAGRQTAGDYRLVVGIDAPEVLDGSAAATGDQIAVADPAALGSFQQIQAVEGSLTPEIPSRIYNLGELNPGDDLYLYLQSTGGNLKPTLILRDYGRKPVHVANLNGTESIVTLEHTFPEGGSQYSVEIICQEQPENPGCGDYRLLAGVNAPQVLEGEGEPNSERILQLPIPVQIGFKLQQIVDIDPSKEIMNAVGTVKMEWTDPALAFNPDDCQCWRKVYTESDFSKFLADVQGRWPDFTLFNQQGNRWTQNRIVAVESNGKVTYLERFTTNFQLNFDFSKYPFDTQDFYIYFDQLYSEDNYVYIPTEGFSEIDPEHGEDEFKLSGFDTQISSEISSRQVPTSRFTFHFSAPRHLSYYIFRIFIPVLLIISVSYVTFFLKDYTRRIEVATGNLLLFIAFSFSIAEDYPRMGYLTFLDAIMAITFIINTLVVVYSVYLKWLETHDQRERSEQIDRYMDWVYPIAYLVAIGVTAWWFLA
jgi:hypothetical protein